MGMAHNQQFCNMLIFAANHISMLKRFNFGGLTAVLFLMCNCSIGQNLIPDPGFENWDGTQGNYMAPLYDWYDVNGTPDHHHIANGGWSNLTGLDTLCGPGNGQTQ